MTPATARPAWLTPDRIVPVIVMFIGLFAITYVFDAAFDRMGVNPASTLFNNFSIGYLARRSSSTTKSRLTESYEL